MIVGVPREIKEHEYRVALLPVGVQELTAAGHRVLIETAAGIGSGISDQQYVAAGAQLVPDADAVWSQAELVVKVKEPLPSEYPKLRARQMVFTYFHFAASRELTDAVVASGATALAYETLVDARGQLCLLTPMSEIAGRLSIQAGAKYLERPQGGRGVLLGGAPGVEPGHVTVLGGGVVGTEAARTAAGLGARVVVLDNNVARLRQLGDLLPANVTTLFADRHAIENELSRADLLVGAVLVRGARAPRLITRDDLRRMKPRSVIVDVAVDQGGCVETTRPTTHSQPTYVVDDIVHYCVTNMPGAVSATSSRALCNMTLPYVMTLAKCGLWKAVVDAPEIVSAINVHEGAITHPTVAQSFDLQYRPFDP